MGSSSGFTYSIVVVVVVVVVTLLTANLSRSKPSIYDSGYETLRNDAGTVDCAI